MQSLQFRKSPCSKMGNLLIRSLRKPLSSSKQVCQAGLPLIDPLSSVHPVAVAYQNSRPLFDQSFKGFLGPAGKYLEVGYIRVDHHPIPFACLAAAAFSEVAVDNSINNGTIIAYVESKTSLHKWSTIRQTFASAIFARYVITISEGPAKRGRATEYTKHHGKATLG